MDTIAAQVLELAQVYAGRSRATTTSRLTEDLQMDSLDRVELAMDVEETFDLAINDDDSEGWTTVGSIVAYVTQHTRSEAA
jgi:acyl carrier protein